MNKKGDEIEELIKELGECKNWLSGLQIETKDSRLDAIIGFLKEILESRKIGDAQILENFDSQDLLYAYYEAISFMKIKRAFCEFRSDQLRKHDLKEILKGPFKPTDENMGSGDVNSRNKLFELELAAIIQNGRNDAVKVTAFNDIHLNVNSKDVFIECKRLLSPRKEQCLENVSKAYEQLQRKIIGKKPTGIIGLAIEKLLSLDEILVFDNDDEAYNFLNDKIENWIFENHAEIWKRIVDRRILGIIVSCKMFYRDVTGNINHYHMLKFFHREKSLIRIKDLGTFNILQKFFVRDLNVLSGKNSNAH